MVSSLMVISETKKIIFYKQLSWFLKDNCKQSVYIDAFILVLKDFNLDSKEKLKYSLLGNRVVSDIKPKLLSFCL